MNLSVDLSSLTVLAIVTGGSHDDYARINQTANRSSNRVVLVTINCRRAEAHVDYANVVLVMVNHSPIQSREYSGDTAGTGRIKDAQIYDVRIRRHSQVSTFGNATVSGCDSRDVRTMTIGFIHAVLASKVAAENDAASVLLIEECHMTCVHTRVYHRDADSRAIKDCGRSDKPGSGRLSAHLVRTSGCGHMPH